jgi:glucosamine--fructose-6-phosphate aminotransferase (isomerizing)
MTDQERHSHPYWLWESIMETPDVLASYLKADFRGEVDELAETLVRIDPVHVFVSGTGSSSFAARAEVHAFEQIAGLSATAHVTSELRAHPPTTLKRGAAWVFNSHSGGSIGDPEAVALAKSLGVYTVAVTDIPGSKLATSADSALIGPGGPKHELPATRTYAAALFRVYMLTAALAARHGDRQKADPYMAALEGIPSRLRELIDGVEERAPEVAERLADAGYFIVIASGPNVATAEEGALGLSQAKSAPGQGFPVENYLHGPIQALTADGWVLALAPSGPQQSRVLQAAKAAKIIGAKVLLLAPPATGEDLGADLRIDIRDDTPEVFTPLLYVAPLWQVGYRLSLLAGHNPDRLSMESQPFQDAMGYLMKGDRKFGA